MNVFISAASGAVDDEPPDDPSAENIFPQLDGGGRLGVFDGEPSATSPSTALRYRWKSMSTTRGTNGRSVGRTSVQSSNNVDRSDSGTK